MCSTTPGRGHVVGLCGWAAALSITACTNSKCECVVMDPFWCFMNFLSLISSTIPVKLVYNYLPQHFRA